MYGVKELIESKSDTGIMGLVCKNEIINSSNSKIVFKKATGLKKYPLPFLL